MTKWKQQLHKWQTAVNVTSGSEKQVHVRRTVTLAVPINPDWFMTSFPQQQ